MSKANWADRTLWTGDNLDILRGMNSESVDLIYLDPPFNSKKGYAAPVGSKAAGAAFKDTWHLSDLDVAWMGLIADEQPAVAALLATTGAVHGKGMQSYLTMMAVRLLEMRRVLKDTGSIYLHCDDEASHYLKMLMDAVFGTSNFRNEVVWTFGGSGRGAKAISGNFPRNHHVLLLYGKGAQRIHNRVHMPTRYQLSALPSHIKIGEDGQAFKTAPRGDYTDESVARLEAEGRIYRTRTGNIRVKYFLERDGADVIEEKMAGDSWIDIPDMMHTRKAERLSYPTQKPLALLERVIAASSNEGDVVLDPFCGCATACVAAEKLARQWIGIDISPKAAELVNVRLQDSMGSLFHHGYVTTRTDIPQRTDVDAPKNYRQNKHVLYGEQEGRCGGCRTSFEFRHFEVDHVVPQAHGGTDHLGNLQLLCGHCNRVKGSRPQEYLVARLAESGLVAAGH